ncbi:MAG: hypothetical protein KatS3mg054_0112 [Chloroflexus sp.]|nr:MAG: hypothetical protein KatS3mg054_0112 [Chloroflexus sp.]
MPRLKATPKKLPAKRVSSRKQASGTQATAVKAHVQRILRETSKVVLDYIKKQRMERWPAAIGSMNMNIRSGGLARKIQARVYDKYTGILSQTKSAGGSGSTASSIVGGYSEVGLIGRGQLPYQRMAWSNQEFGNVIRAKTKKYLAVPLMIAHTSSGVKLWPSPRYANVSFYVKVIQGKKFLGRYESGGFVPYYILKRSVRLLVRSILKDSVDVAAKELSRHASFFTKAVVTGPGRRKEIIGRFGKARK